MLLPAHNLCAHAIQQVQIATWNSCGGLGPKTFLVHGTTTQQQLEVAT